MFRSEAVGVGQPGALSSRAEESRTVIQRLAKRVGAFEIDAVSALIFSGKDDAVIVGVADVFARADGPEEGVWVDLFVWKLVAALGGVIHDHPGLVLVHKQTQRVAVRSLIVHLERESRTYSPLDSQAVLIDVRAANVLIFGAQAN